MLNPLSGSPGSALVSQEQHAQDNADSARVVGQWTENLQPVLRHSRKPGQLPLKVGEKFIHSEAASGIADSGCWILQFTAAVPADPQVAQSAAGLRGAELRALQLFANAARGLCQSAHAAGHPYIQVHRAWGAQLVCVEQEKQARSCTQRGRFHQKI